MERLAALAIPGGLVGGPFGSLLVSDDYTSSGIPVIRGSNMGDRYVAGPYVHVSREKYTRDLHRNCAAPDDLIFTQRGTLGQVALVPEGKDTYVISQSQMRLRLDKQKADPRYVYYACSAEHFVRQVDDHAIRTGVPHINLGVLGRLQIPVPPLRKQQAIAEVLGALDDKIAANARVLALTEERLRALFSLIMAPDDAPVTPLTSIIELNPGRPTPEDPAPHVPMQALPSPGMTFPPPALSSPNGGVRFTNGDTLLARITPCLENGKTGYVACLQPDQIGVGSTEYIVLRSRPGFPLLLSYFIATEPGFRAEAIQRMVGSSGRQRLKADDLRDFQIHMTRDPAALERFEEESESASSLAQSLVTESRTLAQLRDTLLPALMDGRIRVKDAIAAAEEALP